MWIAYCAMACETRSIPTIITSPPRDDIGPILPLNTRGSLLYSNSGLLGTAPRFVALIVCERFSGLGLETLSIALPTTRDGWAPCPKIPAVSAVAKTVKRAKRRLGLFWPHFHCLDEARSLRRPGFLTMLDVSHVGLFHYAAWISCVDAQVSLWPATCEATCVAEGHFHYENSAPSHRLTWRHVCHGGAAQSA